MTTLVLMTPYLASTLGAAMLTKALHLFLESQVTRVQNPWRKAALLVIAILSLPTLAQAAAVDLRTATESGNAIIMYLSATFAAVGVVAAGVAMMMGRQSIAKWAFAGAMVSGLAFAIVKTMWTAMGIEASDVGTF
jgi:hypothetical protein